MEDQKLAIDFLSSLRNLMCSFKKLLDNELQLSLLDIWIGIILTDYAKLDNDSPITASELAKKAHIVPSSLTRVLNKLENLELIKRTIPSNNRRVVYVELTSNGEQYLNDIRSSTTQSMFSIFYKMGKKATRELLKTIDELTESFNGLMIERKGV